MWGTYISRNMHMVFMVIRAHGRQLFPVKVQDLPLASVLARVGALC